MRSACTIAPGAPGVAARGQRTGLARDDDRPVGHAQHADAARAQARRLLLPAPCRTALDRLAFHPSMVEHMFE